MSERPTLRFGEFGRLAYDEARGLLQCHLCGGWYKNVGAHAWGAHQVRVAEYRAIAGLNRRTRLLTPDVRAIMREKALPNVARRRAEGKLKRFNEDPERQKRARAAVAAVMKEGGYRAEGKRHLSESATPEGREARGAKIRDHPTRSEAIKAGLKRALRGPRRCERCGNEYQPAAPNQRFCPPCKPLARRARDRARYARRNQAARPGAAHPAYEPAQPA